MTNAPHLLLPYPYREVKLFQHSPFANRFMTTHFTSLRVAQKPIAWAPSPLLQETRDPSRFSNIYHSATTVAKTRSGKATGAEWFSNEERAVWDLPSARNESYLWSEAWAVTVPQYDLCSIFRPMGWSDTPPSQPQTYRAPLLSSVSLLPSSFYPAHTFCHWLTQHVFSYLIRAEERGIH